MECDEEGVENEVGVGGEEGLLIKAVGLEVGEERRELETLVETVMEGVMEAIGVLDNVIAVAV